MVRKSFEETGHHVFKGRIALNRGIMRKRRSKDINHYNGESYKVELLYRTVHSANQLCVYGAVTGRCETLGRTAAEKNWTMVEEPQSEYRGDKFFSKDTPNRHCFGEPNAPENVMFRVGFTKKSLQILSLERRFFCPSEKRRYYVTLLDADDGW